MITVPADLSQIPVVSEMVEDMLSHCDCALRAQTQILIAVDELMNNIASYAYPGGGGEMSVEFGVEGDVAFVRFIDSGVEFNPLKKADPDTTLSAEARDTGGLGILMVKKSMDSVEYEYANHQNRLTIRKRIR